MSNWEKQHPGDRKQDERVDLSHLNAGEYRSRLFL